MSAAQIPSGLQGVRAHAREIFLIGLPLVGSQLAQVALHVTDTVMLGWYSVEALAGLVLAGTFVFVALVMGGGFALAVMPMVAGAAGTENDRQVRRVTRMGIWLSLIYGACVMPVMLGSEQILLAMNQEPAVAAEAGRYLRIAGWSIFPNLVLLVLRSYFSGLGRTTSILVVGIGIVAMNVPLNYALIFGNWGAPELGVAGAAWASLLSAATGCLAMAAHALLATPEYDLFRNIHRPDWDVFRDVLRLGLPMGATHLAEVGMFSFSSLLVGWVGTRELAAHGIALQITSVTFMVQYGLSQAATVRAGRAYGRQDEQALRSGAMVATVMCLLASFFIITIFLTVPEPLVSLFLDPADPEREPIIRIGVTLLMVAAVFQILDGSQVMAIGLLRGVQDARVPMVMATVSYWGIGVPASYVLGFPLGLGAVGVWLGLVLGLCAAAALLSWRFWTQSSRIGLMEGRASA